MGDCYPFYDGDAAAANFYVSIFENDKHTDETKLLM
jgi:predicted 3-demethylubiquinone-9 3-methyltransferase (glyoxalase superfamily)